MEFAITGEISDSNITQIRSGMSELLNIDDIKLSQREIYLENDTFSLFIYMNDLVGAYPSNNYDFLISGRYQGLLEEVTSFVTNIACALYRISIEYDFEFYQDVPEIENYSTYMIRHPNWQSSAVGIFIDISKRL